MGWQVIWTDEAIADLREIVAFISRDNPHAAVKLGEALIEKSMILATHPRLGRMLRKTKKDALRQLVVPPYRLIYEIDEPRSVILIRIVWHGSRQEPDIK